MFVNMLTVMMIGAVHWQHPGGMINDDAIAEIREKIAHHEWAREVFQGRKETLARWIEISSEKLAAVFPKKCGNVYHNFSCPHDRCRLTFDPFESTTFTCPICHQQFPAHTDAGIYTPEELYHGTMLDGWACIFYLTASSVAADLGLVAEVESRSPGEPVASPEAARGIELLMLFADTISGLPTDRREDPQFSRILTYHREGDNKVLDNLARAYELLRSHMTEAQRSRFEKEVLQRMLEDIMLEPTYRYDHNNIYQWHRTIVQTAIALERDDLIDFSFGYGAYSPEREPEHRSMRRVAATHFKKDGAYWGLNSGYHLYPLFAFCQFAVVSHRLSAMDPERFPPDQYDYTSPGSPEGQVIRAALEWFVALAMPDRSMTVLGDSTVPRAGMDSYFATAEAGYRFFNVLAVGDYPELREGKRSWEALLYGAPEIVQHELPFTSSCLSSGWVSLRNEWEGNRVWVGLNALEKGSGHQQADRLTLVLYSHDTLLALEKATPYNERVTRVLGTLSQAHNTVTVDQTSQKQGEALTEEETPRIAYFSAGRLAQFAELHGDHLYLQTPIYRRSVALIEDIVVDCFRVEGGSTHDWILNHAGPAPTFSLTMEAGVFEPEDWLCGGTDQVVQARTGQAWSSQWLVEGVHSRMQMMGAPETEVYGLETYPIDNAVVTEAHPPCQTLCIRRRNDEPFLAVWDAWRTAPRLQAAAPGEGARSMCLATTAHTYYLVFGPGETAFTDGVHLETDGVFALLRDRDALEMVGGTQVKAATPEGDQTVQLDRRASVVVECTTDGLTKETTPDICYFTKAGENQPVESDAVGLSIEGSLWKDRG